MSSRSNVGDSSAYGNDDQRPDKTDVEERERFKEGKENSHKANDAKDERSIANKLERESSREEKEEAKDADEEARKKDATLPATMKGNKPSKGAKIDQELREEEEEILKKKGAFGPSASN